MPHKFDAVRQRCLKYLCAKIYENIVRFDKVIAKTRGQSNLTKSASRLGVTAGGRNILYH